MYTITRGPSKLTTQRRTGPKQQIDTKLQELKSKQQLLIPNTSSSWEALPSNPVPKLVFNRVNGKRTQTPATTPEEEVYTPAHEENVRFVYQAWQDVQQKLEGQNGGATQLYQDQSPDSSFKNFVPIDLEEWWAERFLANIENCA
ncbi:MAPK regulated corepressor interacting protein 2 [Spea bombifrons]|uniref:MAPK regulated corepressor interacting protein 2 n=1 Tax=Spea bombifrons TaxID=233779 RepID=UPI00234BE17B|nr:MAPK regulated corepressor interacting protein 2 [Spea bombifrons]